ncbi:MAG: alkene reductase [Candidatus Obscuribacterales bacterium]|nr:alkene reductase [Candidatus Obscuribacterales bacterium]
MTVKTHKVLLDKFSLRGLELKNRFVMAPLTRGRAGETRVPNALMAEYYSQRTDAGLIITEATSISQQAIGWIGNAGIFNDAQKEGWKPVVEAVHKGGSRFFLQLWHQGRVSHSDFQVDHKLPVAPSAVQLKGDKIHTPLGKKDYEVPRALETDEIPGIVNDYREAARRAKEAGFDGVEIHSANGYLIDQFLQSKTNLRTDKYGGSVEKRYQFLKEVVEAVTTVFEPGRVGVRLSPNGIYDDMGSPDFREQFLYVAEQLDTYGLAYIHVLDGLAFGFHNLGEPVTLSDLRKVFSGPLMGNCGYDFSLAEKAIEEDRADLIAFGRPYITNPDLATRYANGWPLTDYSDMSQWYSHDAKGYTTYLTFQQQLDGKK